MQQMQNYSTVFPKICLLSQKDTLMGCEYYSYKIYNNLIIIFLTKQTQINFFADKHTIFTQRVETSQVSLRGGRHLLHR